MHAYVYIYVHVRVPLVTASWYSPWTQGYSELETT